MIGGQSATTNTTTSNDQQQQSTGDAQIPWSMLQHGIFQAQGNNIASNIMLPMASTQYAQWVAALSTLAAAASSAQLNPHSLANNFFAPTQASLSVNATRHASNSPKTVSESDQKNSEDGDDGQETDETPGSSNA